ncbi:MAG: hypothetical protein WCJ02_15815 [bacterium]
MKHSLSLLASLLLAPNAALYAADAPNLDRLAREGTRFATTYTVAPKSCLLKTETKNEKYTQSHRCPVICSRDGHSC